MDEPGGTPASSALPVLLAAVYIRVNPKSARGAQPALVMLLVAGHTWSLLPTATVPASCAPARLARSGASARRCLGHSYSSSAVHAPARNNQQPSLSGRFATNGARCGAQRCSARGCPRMTTREAPPRARAARAHTQCQTRRPASTCRAPSPASPRTLTARSSRGAATRREERPALRRAAHPQRSRGAPARRAKSPTGAQSRLTSKLPQRTGMTTWILPAAQQVRPKSANPPLSASLCARAGGAVLTAAAL
jgi:hypothetical protein